MEVFSTYKGNGFLAKELEDELMKFTVKSEDSGVEKGHSAKPAEEVQKNTDVEVEVNITECTKSTDTKAAPPKYQDLTESEGSSSFDESDYDFDKVDDTLDSNEALLDLCGDFDGFGDNFRRKKLTAHWRSFIQPIMWRCKWTELQIKKLQSLAQQYDRELEAHKKRKQVQLVDSTLIDGVKSLPFSRTNARSNLIRRKKRRMAEETTDVVAYMSCHNLFSHFENKKNPTEVAAISNLPKCLGTQKVNTDEEFWANDDLSSFVSGDGDNSLEDILRKIELLQLQAGQLRRRADRVINENADKFFPVIPPFDISPANDVDSGVDVGTYIASQLMSEYNMADDDEIVLEGAVTNLGDDGRSNPNANVGRARLADAYRNVEDGTLIDNRRVKEEMNNVNEVISYPIQKPHVSKDISDNVNVTDLPTADQPTSKMRSIARITGPRSKMKRGRKKGVRRGTRRSTS